MNTAAYRRSLLLTALLLSGIACDDGGGVDEPEGNRFFAERTLSIAHRGGAGLWPEETMVAFHGAADLGVDILEMDLQATSDGVVICMHDHSVDRTTGGVGNVKQMSFAEIEQLDAGYQFTPDSGTTYPYRGQGLTVPSFESVLAAFPQAYFIAEIKQTEPSIVEPVVEIITRLDVVDRIIIASISDEALRQVRTQVPGAHTSLGLAEMTDLVMLVVPEGREDWEAPAVFVHAPFETVDDAMLSFSNRHGLKIHAWTVNDRLTMGLLIEMGVHGIMTDDPQMLAEELAARGAGPH